MTTNRKAVVLAAGKGTRLLPLTEKTPKVLIPIGNRPYILYLLDRLWFAGCRKVAIVIGHLGDQVVATLGTQYRGMELTYLTQERPTGTADALLLAESFVGNEPFMMTWGDIVNASANYIRIWQFFRDKKADAVLLVDYRDDVSPGADVALNEDRVIGIVEKPPGPRPGWNQTGLFVLSPIIFDFLRQVTPSVRGEREFTDAVQKLVQSGHRVFALPLSGFAFELGNKDQLQVLERNCALLMDDLSPPS
ncbi:MAG: sugar phosphate nucleotidyltransferase [Armatimonadetes bacterium]|nr:sugar phosphate nucleotidyltransferase [Armatimonadota bacterium]